MKVLIVGAGKLGSKLAEQLINENIEVTVVDINQTKLDKIKDHLDVLTMTANGLEIAVLQDLSLNNYQILIAVTDSDETNMIICNIAKKLSGIKTIARIRDPEYVSQFEFLKAQMGIDHVVNPDLATSLEIARYLLKSYQIANGDVTQNKVTLLDIHVKLLPEFIGLSLSQLKDFQGLLIVALLRNNEIIIPSGTTILAEDDIIYVMGDSQRLIELGNRFKLNLGSQKLRRVMILGGGKIGYYLAERLIAANIAVTIFEINPERCLYLAEKLDKALIINGDGTDISLLEDEDLASVDALVGATGFDEQNILMALVAKQYGVKQTVSKISRNCYASLINKLEIDFALDPTNIIAGNILKFIRGGKVVSVSLLLGQQAEVTELIVAKEALAVGKSLLELALPSGIIVGTVVRNKQSFIPNGQTIIQADDRLVIFCKAKHQPQLTVFLTNNGQA